MLLRTWFSEVSELGPSPGEESESSPEREILTRSALSQRLDLIVIQPLTSNVASVVEVEVEVWPLPRRRLARTMMGALE